MYSKESEIKKELMTESPFCVFCGAGKNKWPGLTLLHVIRKSESKKYKLMKENCFLACLQCHDVFDNDNSKRWNLPNIDIVLERMKSLDTGYYNRFINLKDRK